MEEVRLVKQYYIKYLFPKMAAHQQAMLVPGIFGCAGAIVDGKPFSLEEQGARIVKKLQAYFSWAKEEPRIAGFWPWHFNNRTDKPSTVRPGFCDMAPGGVAMPAVVQKLQEIGKFIVGNESKL